MSQLISSQPLGHSDLQVSRITLGTMTFGEQVDQAQAFAIMDAAVEAGIYTLDTAEMYAVPPKAETFGESERILGAWLRARPGMRDRVVIATKVAGPGRNMPWVRPSPMGLTPSEIIAACEGSLKRLQIDCIDLYQIHWPARHVPVFGAMYFQPKQVSESPSIQMQLEAMQTLQQAGKIRYVGVSNETAYGVSEFTHVAQRLHLPKIVSVQNPFGLTNRTFENGLDEACHHHQVGLLAYSPLAFGGLTGKYDELGVHAPESAYLGRLGIYASMRAQRWCRPEALDAARQYNQLARQHGLTPTQMALSFCYHHAKVASTIIGVTSVAQLQENVQAWGVSLNSDLHQAIDAIRWQYRDFAM